MRFADAKKPPFGVANSSAERHNSCCAAHYPSDAGSLLLTTPLLHLHFAAVTKAAIIAYNYPLCLLLGYLGALLAWRRGRRLTASAPGEPSA